MTIERAVVKGTIADSVNFRNMFTCEVVLAGGDTGQTLWGTYLDPVYTPLLAKLGTAFQTHTAELQQLNSGSWVTYDEITFAKAGAAAGDPMPNADAAVLIGKAAGLRGIGRKFFSGIVEANVSTNVFIAGTITVLAQCLLAYITPYTGIGGGTITPGIVSAGGVFRPFVGGFVSALIGSMDRRKPGRGF